MDKFLSGSYYTYQRDGLGSITRISDASGNPVDTHAYSPWGDTSWSGRITSQWPNVRTAYPLQLAPSNEG